MLMLVLMAQVAFGWRWQVKVEATDDCEFDLKASTLFFFIDFEEKNKGEMKLIKIVRRHIDEDDGTIESRWASLGCCSSPFFLSYSIKNSAIFFHTTLVVVIARSWNVWINRDGKSKIRWCLILMRAKQSKKKRRTKMKNDKEHADCSIDVHERVLIMS